MQKGTYNYTLIIPHYNIPRLLRRLLRSITIREDLQIIVIDDKSTKELEELKKVKREFPSVEWIETITNGGSGRARNIGLEHAKGKYIIFADADDYFEDNFNQALNDYVNNDYDIIYFDGTSRDSESNKISNRTNHLTKYIQAYKLGKDINANGLRYLFGEPWCRFIKKDIVNKYNIKFDETIIHNDTTFAYLIGYYSKKIFVDQRKIYCVTTRKNSVSVLMSNERILTRVCVFSRAEKFLVQNGIKIFPIEHYNQCARLIAHSNFKLLLKCIKAMNHNGLTKRHIYYWCIKTFMSITYNKI